MKLNKLVERCYYINMEEATERLQSCIRQFEKYEINSIRKIPPKVVDSNTNVSKAHISHNRAVYDIINECRNDGVDSVIIFEDDFLLIDDFENAFQRISERLPDSWDFIYFGGNHLGNLVQYNEYFYRMTHSYSTHMVAINGRIYDRVLQKLKEESGPVDVAYCSMFSTCLAYTTKPYLATQLPGHSYIENEYRDYDHCLKYK